MMTLADCLRLEKYLNGIRNKKDYENTRGDEKQSLRKKKQRPQDTRSKDHTYPHTPD